MPAKKRCFVVSPIGAPGTDVRAHADDVFNYIIAPVTSEMGYETERGDHAARPGRISDQMYDRILHDELLIAVLTFQNPNVYYELAIAHAAARPLIILCEASQANLPFDVKDQRVIFYDLRPRSLFEGTYKKELQKAIAHLESPGAQQEVPFRPNLTPLGGLGESFRVFDRFVDAVSAGSLPFKVISEAEQSLCMAGISLLSLGQYPDVRPKLEELGSRNVETKILIMHEENPALIAMMSGDFKNQAQKVREEIVRSFDMWVAFGGKMPRFSVRKVRRGVVYQQLFMSEKRMIYTPYNMSVTTQYSATIQTDHRSPLYTAQKRDFDYLWSRSDDGVVTAANPKRKKSVAKRSR
jgi:hypothetical protein